MSRVDEILDVLWQQGLLMDYETKGEDISQAKAQLLKHLCDKVDGMKNPRLFKDIDIPRATKFFNLALDEVKEMLKGEME